MKRACRIDAFEAAHRHRAAERKAVALPLALAALRALEARGIRAWVIGSLAKGRFTSTSDVDFAVDCSRDREYEAFRAIEDAMGDFPFHMVPCSRIAEDAKPYFMEGAVDAPGLSAR